MKKLLFILFMLPLSIKAQTVFVVRQDTMKMIAKGNNTTFYQDVDTFYFDSEAEFFEFTKTLTINGNVGIGTSNPSQPLHVVGNVRVVGGDVTLDVGEQVSVGNTFITSNIINGISLLNGLSLKSAGVIKIFSNNIEALRLTEDSVCSDSIIVANSGVKFEDGTIQTTAASGGGVSFGSQYEIPYTNSGTDDFDYDGGFALNSDFVLQLDDSFGNTMIGQSAGNSINSSTNSRNVFLGNSSGYSITTEKDNTFIGYTAGYGNLGWGNIFIGHAAGYNETGSNKLYIDNSNSATPLIYGDFSADEITINGDLEVTGSIKGVMQVAKAEILYTNTSQTTIITLPADAVIWDMAISITTAFNATTSNDINFGIVSDYAVEDGASSPLFAVLSLSGFGSNPTTFPYDITGSTNIVFDYNPIGTAPTQGQAFVYIHYTTH